MRVGDDLGTIAKGPLTLTDIITYHIAIGWGGYGGGTGKVAYKNRKRIPKFYPPNEYGIPDSAQRCHWEDAWAQHLGHPAGLRLRSHAHQLDGAPGDQLDGDDGWLWKMSAAVMKFNYLGDAHRVSGSVTAVRRTPSTAEVDVAIEGRNQRGITTCRATATMLLPTADGPVVHP